MKDLYYTRNSVIQTFYYTEDGETVWASDLLAQYEEVINNPTDDEPVRTPSLESYVEVLLEDGEIYTEDPTKN